VRPSPVYGLTPQKGLLVNSECGFRGRLPIECTRPGEARGPQFVAPGRIYCRAGDLGLNLFNIKGFQVTGGATYGLSQGAG
jgi:hypothetical protein